MKKIILSIILLIGSLCGCSTLEIPADYAYKITKTDTFDIASWQKITNQRAVYKIYIEGDGHAFDSHGLPTRDPTPKGTLMRELAFTDKSENVIYLARPCQFVKDNMCQQKYWTTARFADEVIDAEYQAIKKIVGNRPIILIGYSGGAQVACLLAVIKPDLNIEKIITVAGNLDHQSWIEYHNLIPLTGSLNLADYYNDFIKIPQIHYVGAKDKVVPEELTKKFINNNAPVVVVSGATHNKGWDSIYYKIQSDF